MQLKKRAISSRVVLVLALLVLPSFSHGHGIIKLEETAGNSRGMYELDYELDPKPNTNPKTGFIYSPPPQG
ncbi:PROTEIN putative-RELATED [Salix purpurea]|uniref:PROTEIN putative-RELATED n=1 Tax=Salix purpurea TaxID=77065 RepID=A0A9Q0UQV2_SALPP|nr:PROTEIN putative-RELATED [Salix purpurea]